MPSGGSAKFMTKADLVEALRKDADLSKTKADAVVDLFFDEMFNALSRGERVEIRDFVSFSVKDYKASTATNPKHRRKAEMKTFKKDLEAVHKEFDALIKKTKQLVDKVRKSAAEDLEKAQALVKPEVVAKRTANALKSLTKMMEKITASVEKFEKEQVAKRKKAKAKAKPAKKARVRKAAVKKPVAKKAKTVTDTDRVLNIINRSKKGVGVPTLTKKTGFDDKKVRDIINRTLKQGKIKRVGKGIYVGA